MEDRYVSPLSERYASKEMQYIFSPEKKFQHLEKALGSLWQRRRGSWDSRLPRSRSRS